MPRNSLLRMIGLIAGFAPAAWAAEPEPARRPNVVIILADDLGYSDLGCYGGEIETPNIDRLAGRGVRFSQMYNSARCCPSRASLMTGLYPSQAGIGDFTTDEPDPDRGPGYLGRLNDRCVTIAEALRPAGYASYYVGKWHLHPETGPIDRGFDEFFGYTRGHSHDQYDNDYYIRLPEGRTREIDPPADAFYATDVFNDYAVEFLRQGQRSGRPWLLFVGHSSPHFPVQAPAERADEYDSIYRLGWDILREERFRSMRDLGLVDGDRWTPTPRSIVPVDRDDIANGFPGEPNPSWDSLDEDRRRDLARRMAVFAAMVEAVDDGVGRIVKHLESTGDLDNTLILVLSDNGACYEWGPFGFDGVSRRGTTTLHTGDALREIGGRGTHHSYGSGWANLGNTPFRMYKHFTHEGGISTPFIAHWPAGIGTPDAWIRTPAHVMDILPTLLDAAGAEYPAELDGRGRTPIEGASLLPLMRGESLPDRTIGFDHQGAHALRQGDWKLVWSKRMPHEIDWELYNLADDRCETRDLAGQYPERVRQMASDWARWARRVGVTWDEPADLPSPEIARRPFSVEARVEAGSLDGVIVAQGGREQGYALHLVGGRPAFDIRIDGEVIGIIGEGRVREAFRIEAELTGDAMRLSVDGQEVARRPSPGLIPVQPKDDLSVGRDVLSAAGDYESPNPLDGTVDDLQVEAGEPVARPKAPVMLTEWGEDVTAENAWREYPRPQLRRGEWTNLNGLWEYAVTPKDDQAPPDEWDGEILVPFAIEAPLSGVGRGFSPDEALWYRRSAELEPPDGHRLLLNFEAVDYSCTVWVNGMNVGAHVGGNLPFSIDATDALRDGEDEIVLRVTDATDAPGTYQLHGKQRLEPEGIWYTPVSGIWQTVWAEPVPPAHITGTTYVAKLDGTVSIRLDTAGDVGDRSAKVTASIDGRTVATAEGPPGSITLTIPDPQPWSPESPTLYDLRIELGDDIVTSYVGIREVGRERDENGHWRFTLNGEPIFPLGTLDQGWWPDGLLTPPSDEAMASDIEFLKAAGFNTIRKHIKVEPRRYYTHCDRIGMLVWQDQVSSMSDNPEWTRLAPNPETRTWPEPAHRQFMAELEQMVDVFHDNPSIIQWVPFNEAWGQHQTVEVGEWLVEHDPTRHVNIASGGNWFPVGHVVDHHQYPHPGFPFEHGEGGRFDDFVKVVGEFGGHGYPVEGHLWDPNARNWGYGGLPKDKDDWLARYKESFRLLLELKRRGIAAGIYTQTSDVEGEINGLLTYDRKVRKLDPRQLADIHAPLYGEEE